MVNMVNRYFNRMNLVTTIFRLIAIAGLASAGACTSPITSESRLEYRFHGRCENILGVGEISPSSPDGVPLRHGLEIASLRYQADTCLIGLGITKPFQGDNSVVRLVILQVNDLIPVEDTLWAMTEDLSLQAWLLDLDLSDIEPVSEIIRQWVNGLENGDGYSKQYYPMAGSIMLQIFRSSGSDATANMQLPQIQSIHVDLETRHPLVLYQPYFAAERDYLNQRVKHLEDKRFWAKWMLNWSQVDAIDDELRLTRMAIAELDRMEAGQFSGIFTIQGDLIKMDSSDQP